MKIVVDAFGGDNAPLEIIKGTVMAVKEYGVEIYHHLEVGQIIREYHTNLDGCGYIIAREDDAETAIAKADKVLKITKKRFSRWIEVRKYE